MKGVFYVISDIHNNLDNLMRFLSIKSGQVVCLGDVVGYNSNYNPNLVVEKTKESIEYCIAGNWDYMVRIDTAPEPSNYSKKIEGSMLSEHKDENYTVPNSDYYNEETKDSLDNLLSNLSENSKEWLLSLPTILEIDDFIFVHGGPEQSDKDVIQQRLNQYLDKVELIESVSREDKVIVHGHTHIPSIYKAREKRLYDAKPGSVFVLELGDVISVPSLGRQNGYFNGYCKIINNIITFHSL